MGITSLIRKYFSNLFVSIIPESESYRVYCKVLKKGKLKEKFEKIFEVKASDDDKLDSEIEEYLNSIQEKYNFSYIALYLNSMGQGAINGTDKESFEKNSVDVKHVHTVKFKTWSAYASYIDINWIKKIYSNVGLDFIYSPFVIIYHIMKKSKLKAKPTLFMLNLKDSFTLAVFQEDELLFGAFFKLNNEELIDTSGVEDWENEEEQKGVEELAALDSQDEEEDLSDLEDLNDLEDLSEDSVDEIPDDDEEKEDDEEINEDANSSDIELYGRDMEVYKYLKAALKEYYHNPIYKSDFLDEIVIYDSYEMSVEMIDIIENELYMDLRMHKIDVAEIMCDMAIGEVFHGL